MRETYRKKLERVLPGLKNSSFVCLGEGEDNIAFEVNSQLVARFTKRDAGAVKREAAILDFVQTIAPLSAPKLRYARPNDGFIVYDKLPGVPLVSIAKDVDVKEWPDFASQLGNFLSALNSADAEPIQSYLQVDVDGPEVWLSESKECFTQVRNLIPQLYYAPIAAFLAAPPPNSRFKSVFAHNDLGIEHILVNPGTQQITGVLDWSDAALADPAHDFGKIYRDLGPEVFRETRRAYTANADAELEQRAVFYSKCGVLEDLAYGVAHKKDTYIHKCLTSLRWLYR
jgi:aminoglycoside phosphotransferase (APT) family kinase protein